MIFNELIRANKWVINNIEVAGGTLSVDATVYIPNRINIFN